MNSRGIPWEKFLDTAWLSTAKSVLAPFGKKMPNRNVTVNLRDCEPNFNVKYAEIE